MRKILCLLTFFAATIASVNAQWSLSEAEKDSISKLGQENQENMMHQLGIMALRPGPSGNEAAPNQ